MTMSSGLKSWFTEMKELLNKLPDVDYGFPIDPETHRFKPAADPERTKAALNESGWLEIEGIQEFYQCCSGFDFPNIHNGYDLMSPGAMLRLTASDFPMKVSGVLSGHLAGQIQVIGGNGGGDSFAIHMQSQEVLLLDHENGFNDGVFEVRTPYFKPTVLAPSFRGFLDAVLNDVRAFVNYDENHKYIGART